MQDKKIAVIGAVNIDICGTSDEQLVLYDSNPGNSNVSFGGVGRNIAENICKLGYKVEMITVLADDLFTKKLVEASSAAGISFEHSMKTQGTTCSTYISINNNNGDMILGVSDMKIYDLMTVDFIKTQIDFINTCDIVICDTNIPQDVIEYIANNCTAPLAIDPVSTKKALKLKNVLNKLTIIKPNIYESEVLTGIKIESDAALYQSAEVYHNAGIKYVFISMGEEGVFYSDGTTKGTAPICKIYPVVNASGCGDSFVAAVIWSYLNGSDIVDMAKSGICASAICGKSASTVCEDLTSEHVLQLIANYKLQ